MDFVRLSIGDFDKGVGVVHDINLLWKNTAWPRSLNTTYALGRTKMTLMMNALGGVVRVENGPEAQDILARRLYYVFTDSGESVDEILIAEGLARTSRRDGQHREHLLSLGRKAQEEGNGCLF